MVRKGQFRVPLGHALKTVTMVFFPFVGSQILSGARMMFLLY